MLVELHLAVDGDAELFQTVATEVFAAPVQPDRLAEVLACPRQHLIYANAGQTVVGYVLAVEQIRPDGHKVLWITDLSVTPMMHDQGIEARLLKRMLDHGAVVDCGSAWVMAWSGDAAHALEAEGGKRHGHLISFSIG